MHFDISSNARISRDFLIGYFTVFNSLLLSISIKTSYYTGILITIKQFPLSSFIISSPLILLLGMFTHVIAKRIAINLLNIGEYNFSSLPKKYADILKMVITAKLSLDSEKNHVLSDEYFNKSKLIITDGEDIKINYSKWKYDIFLSFCLITIISFIVIGFRGLLFNLSDIDWLVFLGNLIVFLISIASLPKLRAKYTLSEVIYLIEKSNNGIKETARE